MLLFINNKLLCKSVIFTFIKIINETFIPYIIFI